MIYMIEVAGQNDAEEILNIYKPYITGTSLTFETEVPSLKEFGERIINYNQYWPWLIARIDGQVAGYAYGSKYRERAGYQWCVECSIYIHDNFLRSGLGARLYNSLFDLLKLQGYRNVYAVINLPNDRSVQFHEKLGFEWFASYKNVGYKLGNWKTVGWWQLIINEYNDEPSPPVKFSLLDKEAVAQVLKKWSIN
jgi:phosphinothricin acetyltransferase